jgi:hypothetical protein
MSTYYANGEGTNVRGNSESGHSPLPPDLLPTHLRGLIPREEFDYQTLIQGLRGYAYPRDKITDLLRKGVVVRVKKGLYVFGPAFRRRAFSREVLANLLYGPSYISLEYALQHHGLIPEAVETLTSVTTGRSRQFRTPLGAFTYRMISLRAFRTGVDLIQGEGGSSYLMATKEKALADKLVAERGLRVRSVSEAKQYLLADLRIPPGELARFDLQALERIASSYGSRRLSFLAKLVAEVQLQRGGRG